MRRSYDFPVSADDVAALAEQFAAEAGAAESHGSAGMPAYAAAAAAASRRRAAVEALRLPPGDVVGAALEADLSRTGPPLGSDLPQAGRIDPAGERRSDDGMWLSRRRCVWHSGQAADPMRLLGESESDTSDEDDEDDEDGDDGVEGGGGGGGGGDEAGDDDGGAADALADAGGSDGGRGSASLGGGATLVAAVAAAGTAAPAEGRAERGGEAAWVQAEPGSAAVGAQADVARAARDVGSAAASAHGSPGRIDSRASSGAEPGRAPPRGRSRVASMPEEVGDDGLVIGPGRRPDRSARGGAASAGRSRAGSASSCGADGIS